LDSRKKGLLIQSPQFLQGRKDLRQIKRNAGSRRQQPKQWPERRSERRPASEHADHRPAQHRWASEGSENADVDKTKEEIFHRRFDSIKLLRCLCKKHSCKLLAKGCEYKAEIILSFRPCAKLGAEKEVFGFLSSHLLIPRFKNNKVIVFSTVENYVASKLH
jgi:hypothetical protein